MLDESYRLPSLAELEGKTNVSSLIDFRIAWNEKNFYFFATVSGKKRLSWCKINQPEESEGIQICLDTRDVRNVHRASRFCHRLIFFPCGQGTSGQAPAVLWVPVHRSKGHPNPIPVEKITLESETLKNGYRLGATIPGELLTGYEPNDFPQFGFHYYLVDHEIGNQAMLVGPPFPHDYDPSLWGTLDLVK